MKNKISDGFCRMVRLKIVDYLQMGYTLMMIMHGSKVVRIARPASCGLDVAQRNKFKSHI